MIPNPMLQYHPWRFLVLLLTLVSLLLIPPVLHGLSSRSAVYSVLCSLVLIAAIMSLLEGRWPRTLALALGIPALLGRWLAYALATSSEDFVALADHFVEILFLAFVVVMTLRAVLTQGTISLDSIFGAICAYLILGMAWGSVYSVVEVVQPGSFQASGELADALKSADAREPVLVYLSFVTMATVGYGDITPVSPPARALACLEAIMGQFYIAVLVAALVGIRVSQGLVSTDPKIT
jgi:hypothetical protein